MKKLEMLLEKCKPFVSPDIKSEQYTTPSDVAAKILHHAFMKGDVEGRVVYDLGCGTGKFAIGCALLGAKKVVGFDADGRALEVARENADKFSLKNVEWIKKDVNDITGKCDTVFQNPPFGVHMRKADRAFLKKSLEVGNVVYSVHKAGNEEFINKYIKEHCGIVTDVIRAEFVLPHTYKFHRKESKKILVDIYRIAKLVHNEVSANSSSVLLTYGGKQNG